MVPFWGSEQSNYVDDKFLPSFYAPAAPSVQHTVGKFYDSLAGESRRREQVAAIITRQMLIPESTERD